MASSPPSLLHSFGPFIESSLKEKGLLPIHNPDQISGSGSDASEQHKCDCPIVSMTSILRFRLSQVHQCDRLFSSC